MPVLTDQPHTRAKWRRPTLVRSNTATAHPMRVALLRSSCGHVLGLSFVSGLRQASLLWKRCSR